jgi:purine-binding chemotaxis protein CheW
MAKVLRRERANRQKDLVGFIVGDVVYAVDIHRVREILNPLPMVTLPQSPRSVIGVADHRGQVVPVVDLRQRFHLDAQAPTRRTKWIIVERGSQGVGLVVDAVTDVFGASPAERREIPDLTGHDRRGIAAVYARETELVFVLDVDAVTAVADDLDLPEHAGAAS